MVEKNGIIPVGLEVDATESEMRISYRRSRTRRAGFRSLPAPVVGILGVAFLLSKSGLTCINLGLALAFGAWFYMSLCCVINK